MTPYFADDWLTVYQGDCREVMASMEPASVHCVVTSPPYWGLRDYGHGEQLGLEPTPEEYVANMVGVFREVRRVLRDDGTVWLNLGDSYATGGGSVGRAPGGGDQGERFIRAGMIGTQPNRMPIPGLKPKDLVGIPWRVAFALQADGWYLRSDIIWSKPNPMPESVTDRPTKSHEYLFLLSKSARYYFDADAVAEPSWRADTSPQSAGRGKRGQLTAYERPGRIRPDFDGTRNIRSVWTIATQPYPGAHFATFPPKLVEPCVKAGCPQKVCGTCGAPWERQTKRIGGERYATGKSAAKNNAGLATAFSGYTDGSSAPSFVTTGWRATCAHEGPTTSGVVLDPFGGSGTTGMVAQHLGRRAVLIDLNGDYLIQAMRRNQQSPLGLDVA